MVSENTIYEVRPKKSIIIGQLYPSISYVFITYLVHSSRESFLDSNFKTSDFPDFNHEYTGIPVLKINI